MKKIKLAICLVFSFLVLMSMNINVFAGEWKFDGPKEWQWWYRNDDGSYPHDAWAQIGGKWYHFDSSGYLDVGYRNINGKYYLLEQHGDRIGQMRENEKHRAYSVAADGEVHIYELTGFSEDEGDLKKLRFKETGEKILDVLKDFEMYSESQDDFRYMYSLESYSYSSYGNREKEKPEDVQFFEKNYTNRPQNYLVDVINKKADKDIYDYIILIDLISDSYGESGDYGSRVYEDERGGDGVGRFDYMDIGNNKVKLFYYY